MINNNINKPYNEKKRNFGFFILRHVDSKKSDKLWQICYDKIRILYPNSNIIIIDDNSNPEYVTKNKKLTKCRIINSEYKRRGEVLPYYYFLKLKPFEKMVFFHDGHFIENYIDFNLYDNVSLFDSQHYWNNQKTEINIISKFKNNKILIDNYYNKNEWLVSPGCTTIITFDKLKYLDEKYNFIEVCMNEIYNRELRMCFERIIGLLLCLETKNNISLLGNVITYMYFANGNYKYMKTNLKDYHRIKKLNPDLPIIKIFSGR